jgi:ABC-type multidrug transport system ATPase subunit/pSer/pThr/pTyr-binding forkhead associated (FHA) protein/ABC-type multidrug transport system permease subunit
MSSYSHQPTQVAPAQSWIIGSAPDCDEVVAQPTVSGHHCRLTRQGNQYWIEDLKSRNGTWVNGVPIPVGQIVPIQPNTRVTLGQQVPMPWPPDSLKSPSNPVYAPQVSGGGQPSGRVITIGRSPDSVKQIDLPIIGWNHARIVFENGVPILEDLNSRNGTSIDRVDNRIQRARLDPSSDVYLGSYKIAASELLGKQKVEIGEAAFHKVAFKDRNTMIIGRDPQSDLPLEYPMISWKHARLTKEGNVIHVEDLGSRNGTFVGGIRISGKVLVQPGQEIGLGSYRFQLLESGELAQREYHGNVTIEAVDVIVNSREGKRLIEPVSMTIYPSELVAVMGPAGAGKTTLLKALNGYTKPAEGRVLFNGDSLYDYYDRFRQQLGYVPQDDIVHPQLRVREALYFSARLRTDLSDQEIEARTEKVLRQLKMWDKRDEIIGSPERKVLSGGQRKRVNIALELINDTPVLFLDEPTSGLSSYDAESVIELLKELSTQGKTVITTIHQPSMKIYKMFDDLILVNRNSEKESHGTMVYFGPAFPDSIQFLNDLPHGAEPTPDLSPEMVLSGVENRLSPDWLALYQKSRYYRDFVLERSGKQPQPDPSINTPGSEPKRHFDLTQWLALVKRNYLVKSRDVTQTIILLCQAPLFAALIALVYHPLNASNYAELTPKLIGSHFLMVVAALWFGCNNAARDIVGEWTVYRRERMVTLKLGSYVFSKLALLFVLGVFQCLCLLSIVYFTLQLKSNFGLDLLVLVTATMVGTGLGLCISAFSKTTESAIALLPIVLLPIIALGGGMRPIYQIGGGQHRLFTTIITDLIPSRWAFEANMLNETVEHGWKKDKGTEAVEPAAEDKDNDQVAALHALGDPASKERMQQKCEDAAAQAKDKEEGVVAVLDDHQTHVLCGDAAEGSIPHYLITWTDKDKDGKDHENIARAYRGEAKGEAGRALSDDEVKNNKAAVVYKAVNFRHSFRTSMLVLVGMLGALILGVLGILSWRDKEQQ